MPEISAGHLHQLQPGPLRRVSFSIRMTQVSTQHRILRLVHQRDALRQDVAELRQLLVVYQVAAGVGWALLVGVLLLWI